MEFKRKQRIKGKKAKHYKEWYDEGERYRITWRNQFFGVTLDPAYYACVRCLRGESKYWNFAGRRGTHRTLNAAIRACEYNKKIWDKFLAIEGQAKVKQFKALQTEVFWETDTNSTMWNIPVWVLAKASIRLLEILCGKDLSDPIETSPSSSTTSHVTSPVSSTPAVPAGDAGESGSPTPSKTDAPKAPKKSAKPAKARVKAPKKSAKKNTAKSSTGGKKKRASTKPSKKSKKKRSKSSQKKKSKPSKS